MQRSIVLALALLGACRTSEPTREPALPIEPAARESAPTLEEIADAIDPGPRPALTVDVPAWLAEALGLPTTAGDPQALLAAAREQWDQFQAPDQGGGDAAMLGRVLALSRSLALAERAAGDVEHAPVEVLLVLERVYDLLDAPSLANDRNLFARMIQAFVGALAEHGEGADAAALDQLAELVFGALRKSGDLHRRTVAALLRDAPDHPDIPDVLGRLAPGLLAGDEALAVGVMQRSLAMRGEAATAAHWLDLAGLCSRALDPRCSQAALVRAKALAPPDDAALQTRLVDARLQAKRAHRVVELEDAAGLDDQLERGQALAELQRHAEARAAFEPLIRRYPDDARPVLGLARVILVDGLDFVGAAEVLDRAQPREHLDRDWYELTIGVQASALLYHVLPQVADRSPDEIFAMLRPTLLQMKQDIDALEALGADEGRVLRFLYEVGIEIWPMVRGEDNDALRGMGRGMLERTLALQAEVPGSLHAYTLVLAAAEFSDDRAAALAVMKLAPPAEHAKALAVRRAQAAFDLVASWGAADHASVMLELLDAAAEASQPLAVRRLAVDGRLLALRLGQGDLDLAELERRYRALLDESGGSADAVLRNNLAVVVAEQGRTDEARALWAQAIERAEEGERDMPRLNALAIGLVKGVATAQERESLEELASSGGSSEVRLQAHAWLVAIARPAERRKAERRLGEAATKEAAGNYRPYNLPGRGGVMLRGTVQAGLGYSTTEGLQIQLDTLGVPWFAVPCPVAIPRSSP